MSKENVEVKGLEQKRNEKLEQGIEQSSYSQLSLNEWLTKFGRIYGKRHDKHTTEYMISRLVEEVAELVNPMESQDREKIGPNLADVFSWTCSLAYKLRIDLAGLAWQKYGKNAPRPTWASSSEAGQPSISDFSQPQSLGEWQDFIAKLYRAENARLTPMNALVAMMKDVGDLAALHRKREPLDQITSKVAAILAWTLTISQLLKLDLAEVVYRKYDDRCPVCKQAICDTDICHLFATMYISFGVGASDDEKYVILDSATKFGFRTLVDASPDLQSTKDLTDSLDLINNSDAACILLTDTGRNSLSAAPLEYRQIFEVMACYSVLSKGNVWIFAKDENQGFCAYLRQTFGFERPLISQYSDPGHLRAMFEGFLDILKMKTT